MWKITFLLRKASKCVCVILCKHFRRVLGPSKSDYFCLPLAAVVIPFHQKINQRRYLKYAAFARNKQKRSHMSSRYTRKTSMKKKFTSISSRNSNRRRKCITNTNVKYTSSFSTLFKIRKPQIVPCFIDQLTLQTKESIPYIHQPHFSQVISRKNKAFDSLFKSFHNKSETR